ncbi:NADH-quinone oxidoreductase subunit N [Frischella sp. Ac13]|uniref:NADH-quinone oxidoreductase subunit N n=1 Tax=Frischella japonica TaxID=2741544 RepID=A0ABR7QTZ5_9GAMM|nr:NADH-quinone oxidoreductase subunit N [Frischella japonica]MBC9129707.1 NADH-quinone oxidoreductase subunit N [Frischella japonica]
MMAITTYEFIYLLPLLILGSAIVILIFFLLFNRISTQQTAMLAIFCLLLSLVSSTCIGYKIISGSDNDALILTNLAQNVDEVTDKPTEVTDDINDAATNEQMLPEMHTVELPPSMLNDGASIEDDIVRNKNVILTLFTIDGYGALYTSLILFLSIIVSTLAATWFKNEATHHDLFYLMVLFSALGATTLIYSSHLISFFIGMELLSIMIVGLVGYQYTQKYSLEAAIKYMVLSVISTSFLLMGIAFYYAATGELTFSGLSYQLSTLSSPSILLLLGVCLMLVGIGFKLSYVPFQLWLPDVYQGAPTCVCLLLNTIGKIAIFCAVARLFLLAPIVNNETIRIIMTIMAFCSIIWGNVFSITQHKIKRLLAYSSIAHLGYLLIALIAVQYQVLALETIGVYLIGYMLANICVLGVISLESCSNAKEDHDNDVDLYGLFWRRPIIALAMGIGLLSLAGLPLTVGFIGRFSLILLGVTAELWLLVGTVVIVSAFSLYFYLRLVIILFIKPDNMIKTNLTNTNISIFAKFKQIGINEVFIVGSALFIVFCGVYPKWLFNLVSIAQYLTPQ